MQSHALLHAWLATELAIIETEVVRDQRVQLEEFLRLSYAIRAVPPHGSRSAYGRRVDVLNRGYSGYNTNKAVQLLPAARLPPALTLQRIGGSIASNAS